MFFGSCDLRLEILVVNVEVVGFPAILNLSGASVGHLNITLYNSIICRGRIYFV